MKMKRFISSLAALALTVCLLPAAPAARAVPADVTGMTQILAALDIMTGSETGDFMLERNVTRAEFTKLIMAASPLGRNVGAATTVSPYPDVPYTHWAAPYVEAAVTMGYVNGYLDGTFHPDENITLAMGVTMAVRLLGYTDADFSGAWPTGQMTLYQNLDLDEGISITANDPMTRKDAMYLLYNLLTAPTRTGTVYLNTLGFALTPAGEIDRVAVINAAMDGPVVVESGWTGKLNFDPAVNTTVYRGGSLSTLAALQTGDVVYYSKSMRTLWAYTNKVTGVYLAASPSASAPATVTLAGGKTYAIETADAAYDLSNLGPYQVGDTVTLLLGRNGGVAAVRKAGAVDATIYGVVSSVTDGSYTDANGNSYTAKTVYLTAADGNSYSYPVAASSTLKAGQLVEVTAVNGAVTVSRLSGSAISGKVDTAATKVGSVPFADDVDILDTNGDGAATGLFPSRLAGMTLSDSNVRFCHKNAAGEIDVLILDDATGDLYSYGILTDVQETNASYGGQSVMMGVYQYIVNGQPMGCMLESKLLNVKTGPVRIEGPLQAPTAMTRLTSASLSALSATQAETTGGGTLPVWERVTVYELEEGEYHLTDLERVRSGYSLTGWYDASAALGGRVRVIVARPTAE